MKKVLIFAITIILVLSAFTITACSPIGEKAVENLKDAGYKKVTLVDDKNFLNNLETLNELDKNTLECYVSATDENGTDFVNIYYFIETDDAKDFEEVYANDTSSSDITYLRDSRVFYVGTQDAINVAKG